MRILSKKRCIIGEGPIWNEKEDELYFTNGFGGNEICTYSPSHNKLGVRAISFGVAAMVFDVDNNIIVSHENGVHLLNADNSLTPIYDTQRYHIRFANDMKVGPDGALYVGTQSGKRKGVSNNIDGKLYRISYDGEVTVLLDGLILSNGMEWSIDETKFYHTDSDTHFIREYYFENGKIEFTGRQIHIQCVDGFTVGKNNCLYIGCWGEKHIAVVDTETMQAVDYIEMPCDVPTSCSFCGTGMDVLAITTASCASDIKVDINAGYTVLMKTDTSGRKPYLFGRIKN